MRVLAVGAHPDDVEAYCAGALAVWKARGDQIFVAVGTDGAQGHQEILPEQLAPLRAEEARQAAVVLGAELFPLGEPDGGLFVDPRTRAKMREVLAWARPDLVVTHVPDDYHPDHRAISTLVRDCCGLAPPPLPLLYMDTEAGTGFVPDIYVNLTGAPLETKLRALACHATQVDWLRHHDGIDLLDWVRQAARTRGLQCGVEYAEGYRVARGTAYGGGGAVCRAGARTPPSLGKR
ncbi:MAG TPA: PIG-L deacetylase family protein [Armatimonadota bacterium]|jgi:LmbE family N-acetylglucosaminyl deacetylase